MRLTDDVDVLARTLYGEAEAWDREDAEAIAAVVMNRVRWANWPNTAAAVCQQAWQFSCWNPGDPNRSRILAVNAGEAWFEECRAIAQRAVNGDLADITGGATHYIADYIKAPRWAKGHQPCFVSGAGRYKHLFFNDIDTPPPATAKDALDQARPLSATRTVKGAVAAGTAAVGSVAVQPLVDAVQAAAPLLPIVQDLARAAPWVLAAIVVAAAIWIGWARWDDRNKGLR
jgi:hypothetical protein